ncbi:hypothetical protein [Mycobacterium sp.]|uniref:hypothetical protein n=1 Tax=Mycobacterium sp. TaxID=1785 RepID=UPI003BB0A366
MARARVLIAVGAALIVMSLFVSVPLRGLLGLAITAVISMALFVAGVALIANQVIELRRFKGR